MNKKIMRLAAAPLAIVAAGLLTAPGCDSLTDGLCCTGFKPGTNMLTADWGLEASANLEFGATLQAIGDFSASATAMVNDIGVACKGLAIELGAPETAVGKDVVDPDKIASGWCAAAVTEIGKIKGSITIKAAPARCDVNVSAKVDCEASCSGQAECTLSPGEIKAACEPGKLSGSCSAKCTGSCEGSADVAVNCEGSCNGTCEGMCDGSASGGNCAGTCSGSCRGTCTAMAGAMIDCNGTCKGDCSVDFVAPKCEGTFTPPEAKCSASAQCKGSCDASASAKAECSPPSIDIVITGAGSLALDLKVAALKKWLPQIVVVATAKGELLLGQAKALVELSGGLSASLSGDSAAVFCIIPAADAIGDAVVNIEASLNASASIVTSIK